MKMTNDKDPITLAIDALEKANMQLTSLGANNTFYTREAIDHIRALQSQQSTGFVDVVFDGPPSHESGRFVEVENDKGESIRFGEWVERPDGYWALRIQSQPATDGLGKVKAFLESFIKEFDESRKEFVGKFLQIKNSTYFSAKEALAILDQQTAAQAVPDGWQTIESAPKADAASPFVWVFGGRYKEPELVLADGDWWRSCTRDGDKFPPTHWMHQYIPAAPKHDLSKGE